jgi:hypothetical protein
VVETIWSGARLVEGGQPVAIDVRNDTDTPELVHWHGQMIPSDVDAAAAEEGTPFVPSKLAALGKRRCSRSSRRARRSPVLS